MITNVEFLDRESLDNVITNIHYQVDKVIFFGYHEVIRDLKDHTKQFLLEYCDVKTVVYHEVSHYDPESVMRTMRGVIEKELADHNEIFFDVTGGESLILTAFGMLSAQYHLPVYQYDIRRNQLIEFRQTDRRSFRQAAQIRTKMPGIDGYIMMHGGKVNHSLQKSHKYLHDPEFEKDVAAIWTVVENNWEVWNQFSDFLKSQMIPDEDLRVNKRTITIMEAISDFSSSFNSIGRLNRIIDALARAGVLLDVEHSNQHYRFRFKNRKIKECLWESGSMLELHVYQEESKNCDECQVGVHLDWDGILHNHVGTDVMNEIDVLTLKDNILTFISCKSGKLGSAQSLYALYELQTVADRFGGRYARKKLVILHPMNEIYRERAAEMNIEVVCLHP